jgi:hypothetical protein
LDLLPLLGEISLIPILLKIVIIPWFPFQVDFFVANGYLLFRIPCNFGFFHISFPVTFAGNDRANLLSGTDAGQKNPRRGRLEFLRAYTISLKGS